MGSEAKENAKRAMRELFGSLTGDALKPVEPVEDFDAALPEMPEEDITMFQTPAKAETTKIGSDTVITGTVKSAGALEIHGTVYGDVYSDDNVYLYGHVAGNVNCRNFCQYAGAVKGNVTVADNIEIGSAGAILGDLVASGVRSDGRVSGNVTSTGKVELLDNAVVVGDISARYFTMKNSACLRGVVRMDSTGKDVERAFDDCFNF